MPLHSEFLQHGATSEVNVSANVQEGIDKDLHKPTRYAFSAAQVSVHMNTPIIGACTPL